MVVDTSLSTQGSMASRRRVAVYARVSTLEQNVDLQLDSLRELCQRRGWIIHKEYVDQGVSGAKEKRPALDELQKDAHRGKFEIVAIWKLDRMARSTRHLLNLSEEFSSLGVDLFSLTETIDSTTPHGRMLFTVLGAIAEFERDLIRERICAGMKSAKARGKKIGRPRLEPTEEELEEIQELQARGLSIRKIAEKVSWFPSNDGPARHPSAALVHRHLKELSRRSEDGQVSQLPPPSTGPRSESALGRPDASPPDEEGN